MQPAAIGWRSWFARTRRDCGEPRFDLASVAARSPRVDRGHGVKQILADIDAHSGDGCD
jgi:hypothetical protein